MRTITFKDFNTHKYFAILTKSEILKRAYLANKFVGVDIFSKLIEELKDVDNAEEIKLTTEEQ